VELLAPAGRCAVDNDARRQEREVVAEDLLNVVRAVAVDGEAAAFSRWRNQLTPCTSSSYAQIVNAR
jgi:hypothetical protein